MGEPGGDLLELLARVGGLIPKDQGLWFPTDEAGRVAAVVTMVKDLDQAGRDAFLSEWSEGTWRTALICSCWHPNLDQIIEHVNASDGDLLLLATPSGPRPPAVAVVARTTDA